MSAIDKLSTAKVNKDFYRKQIEDTDKDRIAHYLFATDANGQSQLMRDLSDPTALVELAFFRTQRNLLTDITNYWKSVLKNERKKLLSLKRK